LLDLGCTLAQGYHLGRPMPADDVLLILQQPVSASVVAGNGHSRRRRAPETRAPESVG
jgi:predicted signal transduction protein with EAL and GGDEF domain